MIASSKHISVFTNSINLPRVFVGGNLNEEHSQFKNLNLLCCLLNAALQDHVEVSKMRTNRWIPSYLQRREKRWMRDTSFYRKFAVTKHHFKLIH